MGSDLHPAHLVGKLDNLVAPAAEPENAILVDQSRLIRWVGPMFALCSVVLVPWIVYIAVSLPSRQLSPNYDISRGSPPPLRGSPAAGAGSVHHGRDGDASSMARSLPGRVSSDS